MPLKALIFDVDGTLAETEEIHRQAFNETFEELGLEWHWDRALYGELLRVTGGKERILHYLGRHRPAEPPPSMDQVAEIHALKTERFASFLRGNAITFRPGVGRLIEEASSTGVRLAIATTTNRANVVALLQNAAPQVKADTFEVIVAGDEVPRKKPWPDVYEEAVGQLKLQPTECVAIEDSSNGLLSARQAGLCTVATPSLYTAGDDFDGAVSVLSHLGEPQLPFVWINGAGSDESMVTVVALNRWLRIVPADRSLQA